VMDALGSAIRIDTRGREVMRILPRVNDDVNEEWISDKTRHVVDGLRTQRLDQPYIREDGRLRAATWSAVFEAIAARVKNARKERIGAIVGDLAATEEIFALKDLMTRLGVTNLDCRQDGSAIDPAWGRASYLFNATIAGIDQSDALLIIGSNPRWEGAVLNARIRKRWRQGKLPVGVIGDVGDMRYAYEQLGAGPETLMALADGEGSFFETLKAATHPLIIVGQGALARLDGAAVLGQAAKLAQALNAVRDDWNGFAVLHTAAARVGGLDIGFVPPAGTTTAGVVNDSEVLFLLGADELLLNRDGKQFVVYVGSHGDAGAHVADVILPGATYTEKSGTYVNTEGRVQQTSRAGFAPGEAKEDWAILRALSDVLGKKLPFDSLAALRRALYAEYPHLQKVDQIAPGSVADLERVARVGGELNKGVFTSPVKDFYLTNPIARASAVMAECSALAKNGFRQAAE
jgi:NADH-quinone oxidoreductase subunit G